MARGTEALQARQAMGYKFGEVDQAAVDGFVVQAKGMPVAQRKAATDRLLADLKRGVNPFGNDKASFATVAAIVDALDAI